MDAQDPTEHEIADTVAETLNGACARFASHGVPPELIVMGLLAAALRAVCATGGPEAAVVWLRTTADLVEQNSADPATAAKMTGCKGSA